MGKQNFSVIPDTNTKSQRASHTSDATNCSAPARMKKTPATFPIIFWDLAIRRPAGQGGSVFSSAQCFYMRMKKHQPYFLLFYCIRHHAAGRPGLRDTENHRIRQNHLNAPCF